MDWNTAPLQTVGLVPVAWWGGAENATASDKGRGRDCGGGSRQPSAGSVAAKTAARRTTDRTGSDDGADWGEDLSGAGTRPLSDGLAGGGGGSGSSDSGDSGSSESTGGCGDVDMNKVMCDDVACFYGPCADGEGRVYPDSSGTTDIKRDPMSRYSLGLAYAAAAEVIRGGFWGSSPVGGTGLGGRDFVPSGGDGRSGVSNLVPPESWDTYTACSLDGTSTDCQADDITRDIDDLWDLDILTAAVSVNISGATEAEAELLYYVWALLQANTDLIVWAVCWVAGDSTFTTGNCIINDLNKLFPQIIRVRDDEAGAPDFHTDWLTKKITIRRNRGWWRTMTAWNLGRTGSADLSEDDAACVLVDLTCTILHELTHVCYRAWTLGEESGTCKQSYLIENAFRWAIMRRYSFVFDSACCAPYETGEVVDDGGEDRMVFGYDDILYANHCVDMNYPGSAIVGISLFSRGV